jgi:hypothetical protein
MQWIHSPGVHVNEIIVIDSEDFSIFMNTRTLEIASRALHIAVLVILTGSTFVALWSLLSTQPFGHDEAVYLAKARSWIDGSPANEFGVYRPIGMAAFGWLFLQFGDSESMVRIFGALFGAMGIGIMFLFFQRISNMWAALAATAVIATSTLFLREAPQFLNDIPSSMLLIALMWIIYVHFLSAGKSNVIYLAAPVAALAFYLRYGVIMAFAVIAVVSYLVLLPRFLKKEGADFTRLGKTILLFGALLVPHILHSIVTTKSFFGILRLGEDIAGRKYLGEGLVTYLEWLPGGLAGWMLEGTAIFGVIATLIILFIPKLRHAHGTLLWTGSIGLYAFILTGLLVHAEARYVFFPLVLLSGTGVLSAYYFVEKWSKIAAQAYMMLLVLGTLYLGMANYKETELFYTGKEADVYRMAYLEAADAIRNDSGTKGCSVWAITTYRPALAWYSKCNTYSVTTKARFERDRAFHPEKTHYSIVLTKVSGNQLTTETAPEFGVMLTEVFRSSKSGYRGDLVVYRIDDALPLPAIVPSLISTTTATSS